MKTSKRAFLGLVGGATVCAATRTSLALPAPVKPAEDTSWMSEVAWIKSNGPMGHFSTMRAPVEKLVGYQKPQVIQVYWTMGRSSDARDLQRQLFHGNAWLRPSEISGLSAHYSTRDTQRAQCAVNVVDARGRGEALASAWVVAWGEDTVCLATPDGNSPEDEGDAALVIRDWRYVARVANIARHSSVDEIKSSLTIALLRLPSFQRKGAIYVSPSLRDAIGPTFRSVPVRGVNALDFNEAELND